MRAVFVILSVLLLSLSSALAVEQDAPLPAGKAAGLQQAQLEGSTGMLVVAGAALVGITVGLATAGNDASQPAATTTSSSTTTTTTTGTSP